MRAGAGWGRGARLLAAAAAAWLSAAPAGAAVRVDSFLSLLRDGKRYDGMEIEVEGEAVGDVMPRGPFTWVNLRSPEDVALGIVLSPAQARLIRRTGDYTGAGDRIRAVGIFHRFAGRYGGETCLVAREVTVVRRGAATPHPVSGKRVTVALCSTALAAISLVLLGVKRRRSGPPPSPPSR